jgi:NAD(P)-dependent dehydrogenase (short-subunit alcohol dehydrogenase family)
LHPSSRSSGSGVYPIADLHDLDGLRHGFTNPIAMADGYGFIGAKSYKDSKLCLMMMSNFLHTKYHKLTGIAFSSMYPGCIAESPLFREKRAWFRKYFPIFMKFITGMYICVLCVGVGWWLSPTLTEMRVDYLSSMMALSSQWLRLVYFIYKN